MNEIDESILLDVALGLCREERLLRAVNASPELRRRLERVEGDLRELDRELAKITCAESPVRLPKQGWRILLTVDASDASRRAAETAAVLAGASGGRVLVFHVRVRVNGVRATETPGEAQKLIDGFVRRLREAGVQADGMVCADSGRTFGARAAEAARLMEADLMVVASRASAGLPGLITGSATPDILRLTKCPIIVVR